MIVKLIAFAFLFTFTINGQESSLAAALQPFGDKQQTIVRLTDAQSFPMLTLLGFRTANSARNVQAASEARPYLHRVDGDEASAATPIVPMTSITVDTPESQLSEADKERVRQEQLQQQLSAKENELAILRDKAAVATNQLTVEKTRADTLEAQLTQKEQELSGICAQRDTQQQMSQDLIGQKAVSSRSNSN
ncbi:MAG: hypothetical protein HC801_12275 [Nitrospira sp.]|nr:hypothetical protein [Nitrospira sp.]